MQIFQTSNDLLREAQLHQEMYIALLKSALREIGSKGAFAEHIGITSQYLSYLLDPYNERTAHPDLARKMALVLPLEPEQRERLFEHLCLASERRLAADRATRKETSEHPLEAQVERLGDMHHQATTTADPLVSKSQYQTVRDAAKEALRQAKPRTSPVLVARLCFLVHDAQCVLNRPDDALNHAKIARIVLEGLGESRFDRERERLDTLYAQALRAEAVAYHNLKLFRQAYDACQEAETSRALYERPEQHKPYLYRDKINALCRWPRFTVSEVESLADQARTIFEGRGDPIDPLWLFLTQESLGRAYLQYGNLAKASRTLQAQLNQIEQIPLLGPLHRTMFFRTSARLHWKQGDLSGWGHFIRLALNLAAQAGLTHQSQQIMKEYGLALQPVLTEQESSQEMLLQ